MGWQDRDWAKWTDEERDRFLGRPRPLSTQPRGRRARRRRSGSGSIWTRDVSKATLVILAVGVALALLARTDGGLGGFGDRLTAALSEGPVAGPVAPPEAGVPTPQIGGPWLEGVITYFNAAPEHAWALRQAVAAWNESGARVRFVAAVRRSAAVVIASATSQPCGHGRATRGYSPRSTVLVFQPSRREGCDRFSAARVLAHELGHVIGLRHIGNGCAAMNATGNYRGAGLCAMSEPWRWRCRLLERTDVLAATRLYGGTPAPVRGRANCSLYRRVGPPDTPRLLPRRSISQQLAVSFRRPADVTLPQFLDARRSLPSFALAYRHGRCATGPDKRRYRWSVAPGGEQVVVQPILGSGIHCLRVWAVDELGRPSKTAATLRVDVNV